MARTGKGLYPIDVAIARILLARIDSRGVSRRALSLTTGMSANRIGIILRAEQPPATVGEVGALARECGMTAGEVVALAEEVLAS